MKGYNFYGAIIGVIALPLLYQSCHENTPMLPSMMIDSIKFITHSSAIAYVSHGDNNDHVIDYGVCWSRSSKPTIEDNFSYYENTVSKKAFIPIDGLIPDTEYFVRAYGQSGGGVSYSEQMVLRTSEVEYLEDSRDGQSYKIINIGTQKWMAENLNYYTNSGSLYYDNDSITYAKDYGRLYNYKTACKVCPNGWHLPDDEEWKKLEMVIGMSKAQVDSTLLRGDGWGGMLKSPGRSFWSDIKSFVSNNSEFTAKGSGIMNNSNDGFYSLKSNAYFWSITNQNNDRVWVRILSSSHNGIERTTIDDNFYISVRCVKD